MDSGLDAFINMQIGVYTNAKEWYEGILSGLDASGNLVLSDKNPQSGEIVMIRADTVYLLGILE